MSANLYRGMASAEFVGVVAYAVVSVFALVSLAINWGGGWVPVLAVASIVSARLSLSHWRERSRLIREAREIEENEQA